MRPKYVVQRLMWMFVSLIGISLITFIVSHMVPADPIRAIAGLRAKGEQVEELRRRYGLDKPLHEQYIRWVVNLTRGDLGMSIRTGQPVREDLQRYAPATAELALAAMFLTTVVGLPLGVIAALHKDRFLDHFSRIIALSGVSMPIFWVALLLQILFFSRLNLLPADGRLDIMLTPPPQVTGFYTIDSILAGDWVTFKSAVLHLILPATTLAFGSLAMLTRMVRSSMLDVLGEDYIRTARAKGLAERRVVVAHALRNALIPTTTTMALLMGALMGGVFLVELMFSWPGLGFYAMRSVSLVDFPAIMGVAVLMTVIYAFFNFIADLLYGFLDPRISIEGGNL
ncbi:MAG: ABC transporter permease [Anaerolineae bacterium]